MTALIVIGCILLFFLLIGLLRVGVSVLYSDDTPPTVRVLAGPVRLTILPAKKKPEGAKKPKKKKKKKPKPKPEPEPGTEKPKPSIMELIDRFLPPAIKALGRFKRKLSCDRLIVRYTVAGTDAAATAIQYGYITAAIGGALPLLHDLLNIKRQEVFADVDFTRTKPSIYADVQFTIAIWQVIYMALAMVPALLPRKSAGSSAPRSRQEKPTVTTENGKVENNG